MHGGDRSLGAKLSSGVHVALTNSVYRLALVP
jgi:hypothetical protein